MVNAGTAIAYLDLDVSKFTSKMQTAGQQLGAFTDDSLSLGKRFEGLGAGLKTVGMQMSTAITLPLMAVGGASVKTAMDFDAQMSKVQAISGATAAEFDKMRQQAIQLGADTAFSASEAAAGMENLASAGFSTSEVMSAMPGMLDLAAAGGIEVADAAEIASSALRGFGLEADQSGHVADVFAKVAADTNSGILDMGEAMKYAAPVAASLGLSIEDTSAAIGLMSNAGIKGSQAGTTLRASLLRLANPSKEASGIMKELGFTAFDAEGKMKTMPQIIGELGKSMEGMTEKQKAATLANIFGMEAVSGMMALIEQGPEKLGNLSEGLENSEGSAKKMAETMLNNLKGAVDQLMGSFETVGIIIGTKMTPFVQDLAVKIKGLADWFTALPSPAQNMILIFAGILAAIGPLLLIFGQMAFAVSSIAGLFATTGVAAATATGPLVALGPVLAGIGTFCTTILAPIAAVGAALYLLYQHNETFRNGVQAIWESVKLTFSSALTLIKQIFKGAVQFIQDAFNVFKAIFSGDWNTLWASIKTLFNNSWSSIKTILKSSLEVLKGTLKIGLEVLKTIFSTVWGALKGIASTALDGIKKVITEKIPQWKTAISDKFTEIKGNITQKLGEWKTAITDWFGGIPAAITAKLVEWKNAIVTWTKSQHEENKKQYSEWGKAIIDWFKSIPENIKTKMNDWKTSFVDGFVKMKDGAIEKFKNIKDTLLTDFSSMPSKIKEKLDEWGKTITNFFKGIGDKSEIKDSGKNIVKNVVKGTDEQKKDFMDNLGKMVVNGLKYALMFAGVTILATGRELIKQIVSAVKTGIPQMLQVGKDIVDGVIKGIGAKFGGLKAKVTELANNIPSWLKKVLKIQSPSKVTTELGEFVGEGLVVGMGNKSEKVKKKSQELADKVRESLDSVNGFVKNTVSLIEKQYELWHLKNKKLEGSSDDLTKQLEMQKSQHTALTTQIDNTEKALNKIIAAYGKNSAEALQYRNQLLDLQIEQQKVSNSIEDTTAKLNSMANTYKYVGQVMSDGKIYQGINSLGKEVYKVPSSGGGGGGSKRNGPAIGSDEDKAEKEARRKRDRANGMPDGYATGTDNATQGWHWVGEEGPELAYFSGGETVMDSKSSISAMIKLVSGMSTVFSQMSMMSMLIPQVAASGTTIQIDVHDNTFRDGNDAGEKIASAIRRLGL